MISIESIGLSTYNSERNECEAAGLKAYKVRESIKGMSFIFSSWGWMRLSPFGTLAIMWPIVPVLNDG
jgi:hypothetical protein